jgi:hypothetical protein
MTPRPQSVGRVARRLSMSADDESLAGSSARTGTERRRRSVIHRNTAANRYGKEAK